MNDSRDDLEHPMQPVGLDESNVIRFKENKILCWLFETGKLSLNEVMLMPFSAEDKMQIAQLLGYSVSGYGDLNYVTNESYAKASAMVEHVLFTYRRNKT